MERIEVRETKFIWNQYNVDGSLSKLIERLQTILRDEGDLDIDCDVYEEYGSSSVQIEFSKMRPETDLEYNVRLTQQLQYQVYRRQQYEQLKKEFE
jgi:hypothetical protein